MTPEQFQRVKRLYEQACELPEGERAAFLDRECPDDPMVRAKVEELLDDSLSVARTLTLGLGENPGDEIGPYTLVRKLGEGGIGVVWQAQERGELERSVAVKLIKPGMDSREVLARFESERQALALMEHPGIAKVYRAGATAEGRPYFAMEFVPGLPITEFCDEHALSTQERLRLFREVCDAVQHAHQKGVIHRDLKPSNVLVALRDGRPAPMVIDFGVAKATQLRRTEASLFTRLGQIVGTPAYMSPEQATASTLDIDTRTDVYSLGVLLYELLTGALPFDEHALRHAGFEEIRRLIRESEPSKPSARVSTLGDRATDSARHRRTSPRDLRRELTGDLDWITMKALEKDRGRRYPSASELAADIERHERHEPVVAGPPSLVYRARKFARRHRAASLTAASVVVALIVGVTLLVTAYARAESARRLAETEAARANEAKEFLKRLLWYGEPGSRDRTADTPLSELLEKASKQIDADPPAHPEIEAEMRATIGMAYRLLGLYDPAERHLSQALAIYQRELGMDSDAALQVQLRRALILENRGEPREAEVLLRDVYETRRHRLGEADPSTLDAARALAVNLNLQGNLDETEAIARGSLEAVRAEREPDDEWLGSFVDLLASVAKERGDHDEAEQLYAESIRIARRMYPGEHDEVLRRRNNHANLLLRMDRAQEAEAEFRSILEVLESRYGDRFPHALSVRVNLARCRMQLGDPAGAAGLYRGILEARTEVLGPAHPGTLWTAMDLAEALRATGEIAEAEARLRSAVEVAEEERPTDRVTAALLEGYGDLLLDSDRPGEAESAFRRALEVLETRYPDDHPAVREVLRGLVNALETNGDAQRADEYRNRLDGRGKGAAASNEFP